jgi:ParB/RepB/Spo0J family partition protein
MSGEKEPVSVVTAPKRSVLSNLLALHKNDVEQAILVELDFLQDNPYQPRLKADESNLKELAQVIKAQGFQGVLIARPHPQQPGQYQLTAGHRRREASRQAGLTMLPVVVKELSEEEMAGLAITENIQREDLTPLEEGRIFLLMAEEMEYTHEQIAREIGKNRGYVENRLRVARAPQDIQRLVAEKPDSLRAIATLIKVTDPARRREAIELLKSGKLTADDLPSYLAGPEKTPTTPELERDAVSAPIKKTASEKKASLEKGDGGEFEEVDARTLERVALSKLATVWRGLQQFQDNVEQRQSMSAAESEQLKKIEALVKELIKKHPTTRARVSRL